jgi:hypothetical protein
MADFILLPSRAVVGEEVARVLRSFLPGVRLSAADGMKLLQEIADRTNGRTFLVHPEDLEGDDIEGSLRDGFGAQDGDRVVSVKTHWKEATVRDEMYLSGHLALPLVASQRAA